MDTKIINHSGYILKLCTTKLWAVDRETKLDKRTLLDPASATRKTREHLRRLSSVYLLSIFGTPSVDNSDNWWLTLYI